MITLNLTIHKAMLSFSTFNKNKCIKDINDYLLKDNWCKSAPRYQTWPVLFKRTENHWIELKTKINEEIKKYYNLKNSKAISWAYVCKQNEPTYLESKNHWHVHDYENHICSAIFYLGLPDSAEATEFMDSNGDVYRPQAVENTLIIFDSKIMHRPAPYFGHRENRYAIAVDYEVCYE